MISQTELFWEATTIPLVKESSALWSDIHARKPFELYLFRCQMFLSHFEDVEMFFYFHRLFSLP